MKKQENSVPMAEEERLEEIAQTLESLRSALKSKSGILRRVAESRLYSILAMSFGISIAFFGILAHFASRSPLADPGRLAKGALAFFLVFFAIGGGVKIYFSRKLTESIDPEGFRALLRAIYGGRATSLLLSAGISMGAGAAFLASKDLAGYIVPLFAIFIAIASHALDLLIDLVEYKILAWSCFVLGLGSLPFAESYPWLCCAASFGLSFMAFGIAGLARAGKWEKKRPSRQGGGGSD
ncbi:MAG TPA: hypothetical protein VIO60_09095 [Rectinemataceae bacterium]